MDPQDDNPCYKETFGPVLVIKKFEGEEEVVEVANNTTYGLSGGFLNALFDVRSLLTG